MKILNRYLLLDLAGPFFTSLSLLTFILFMRHMATLFPRVAGKNLEWSVIAELVLLSLPFIMALVMPMAVLVAVIMSFGRLASDNEITAFKAMGIPVHRLIVSPMAGAFVLMLAAIVFNDRILPEANHRYKTLLMDIAYLKPTLRLHEGVIMDNFPGMGILINRIKEQPSGRNLSVTAPDAALSGIRKKAEPAELFGIIITQNTSSSTRRTIVADSGYIRFTPDRKDAVLTLFHGEIQEVDPQHQEQFQRLFFDRHQIRLQDAGGRLQRGRTSGYRTDRELSLKQIEERVRGRRANLDSLLALATSVLDSLPDDDSTSMALKTLLAGNLAKEPPDIDIPPRELSRLSRSTTARSLNDPK
ncbi:MAG: LptF/LptG family permease, partial [Gemmatimonadota bacterium]|nr:LptF/LptG family permease [Gemmatimonadota bacterium]